MTTVALSPPPITRRKRRFVRENAERFQLTDRDVMLVRLVAKHRFLRSTHLSELCEAPHKKVCDRLTSLFHAGYLDRPRAQFDHYREGGGSSPIVYALGNRGAQLLIERHGAEVADVDWTRKNGLAGRQFILHTLAIADVRVALQRAVRNRPGFQLLEPAQLLAMAPADTSRKERPWSWRAKVRYNDTSIDLGVAPDYAFAIQYPDGRFRAFLVECDRGTMPVDRSNLTQTSLKRKFLAYAAAKRAELHQLHFSWKTFRVLLITTNRQRADNVLATIRECVHEHARGLFLIADRQSLAAADIVAYPWRDARGQTLALV
jgi:Replication-relaxation